jgi:Arc/MetJ-type ribon-helix-helix transcriptional regulator
LAADKVEEALKILRGQFGSDSEVINKLMRLSHTNRENSMGHLTRPEANSERAKIISDVLTMLKDWDETND